MTGELDSSAQDQLTQTVAVFEGAMAVTANLAEADMVTLAAVHGGAARMMVEHAEFAVLAGDITEPGELTEVSRRARAYGFAMLAVERVVDHRNPGVQPPLSQRLRARAREIYGDRVDKHLADLPDFPFA
jgi:hypothetical protein